MLDHGGIPLAVIQKYLNVQFSVSMHLFGSDRSTNAGNYSTAGLKGRLELHQTARRCGVPPAELAELDRQDPALLAADGADRVLTAADRGWLTGRPVGG